MMSIAIVIPGCQKDDSTKKVEKQTLTVSPDKINCYSQSTQQLTSNMSDVTYSAEDEYYATVSESGLVTGEKVGSTNIIVTAENQSVKVPIKILPKYDLYPDVASLIGCQLSKITDVFGADYEGKNSYISYNEPTQYTETIMFKIENNICTSCFVLVPISYLSMLTSYIQERYTKTGTLNNNIYFYNHNKEVLISVSVYSLKYYSVFYAKP